MNPASRCGERIGKAHGILLGGGYNVKSQTLRRLFSYSGQFFKLRRKLV
jgi:hypothetical protein